MTAALKLPVVLRPESRRSRILFRLTTCCYGLTAWLLWEESIFLAIGAAIFSACFLTAAVCYHPSVAAVWITDEGIIFNTRLRRRMVLWREIETFGSAGHFERVVAWRFAPGCWRHIGGASYSRRSSGYDACLGHQHNLYGDHFGELLYLLHRELSRRPATCREPPFIPEDVLQRCGLLAPNAERKYSFSR